MIVSILHSASETKTVYSDEVHILMLRFPYYIVLLKLKKNGG